MVWLFGWVVVLLPFVLCVVFLEFADSVYAFRYILRMTRTSNDITSNQISD